MHLKPAYWLCILPLSLALVACGPTGGPDGDMTDDETVEATPEPTPAPTPKPVAAKPQPTPPPVCGDCGTVSNIELVKAKGEGSGMGALAGAVMGGVIGHQFGGGSGKDAATAAGAIGGAFAGHEAEKRFKGSQYYRVTVSMEAGGSRTVNLAAVDGISVGTPVRVVGENLQLR